jgi:putative transposase
MNKTYKIKLYPNKEQKILIDKTIGCCRFLYNQMLNEKINVYELLKDNKEELYSYKYKTEKQYKEEFEFLKEVSFHALQQSRRNLEQAYKNFYRRIKNKVKEKGFPKFKSKKLSKNSYKEINGDFDRKQPMIMVKDNKIKLPKLSYIKFKGLDKDFQGKITSVTIIKNKDCTYEACVLVEQNEVKKQRKSNNIIGIDLGLKEFIVCSDGNIFKGIKDKLYLIEKEIKKIQKHLSRKQVTNKKLGIKNSKRYEKTRIKLAKLFRYKTNLQNHFFWHLANKLCSENQAISLEDLSVQGMIKNHRLSHSISYSGWSNFVEKLIWKSKEYDTEIFKIGRFFPSSKLCSNCGQIKQDLKLSDRTYFCDCGLEIDRDLNASINIRNFYLKEKSLEYSESGRAHV